MWKLLIILVTTTGVQVETAEFTTQEACADAIKAVGELQLTNAVGGGVWCIDNRPIEANDV